MPTIPRSLIYQDINGDEQRLSDADLLQTPCPIVILGEPGMGKTHLLEALGTQAGRHYVTARKFLRSPAPGDLVTDDAVLVIDALDEVAAAAEQDPINAVLAQLAAAGHPPFILSCRGADWQSAIGRQDIADEYGQEPLVLTLEAITAGDAADFAETLLGRPKAQALIAKLEARSLQRLYGNPLTLGLVCKVVLAEGRLPDTRFDLYDRSCDWLRREDNKAHGRSSLANLTAKAFLDSAGVACAALLITGSEAISLEPPGALDSGDLHVAEVEALPGGAGLRAALASKLFVRKPGGDRFGVLHKTLAEFVGARWLASLPVSTSRQRLYALIAPDGGPPASLRGLHAWLSAFEDGHARAVITTDPYGVLRYADPTRLSDDNVRRLLEALRRLSVEDPQFRSGDWRQEVAPGLARRSLVADLDRLIADPKTEFQFRMLLLEVLEGQVVAADLAGTLQTVMEKDGRGQFHFAERRAAADALIAAPGLDLDWPKLLEPLLYRSGEDPRRLGVELITKLGPERFPVRQIAEAGLSYLNLMPGQSVPNARSSTAGVTYLMAKATPGILAADVLDAIVSLRPTGSKGLEWEVRWGLAELVDFLIMSVVEAGPPAPGKLVSWLRLTGGRDGYRSGRDQVLKLLRENDVLRRGVQYEALIVARDHPTLWERYWRLADLNDGLHPQPADLVWLIEKAALDPADADQRAMLGDLVRIGRSPQGIAAPVLAAVEPYAVRDAEFAAYLAEARKIQAFEWEKKDRARRRRRATKTRRRWAVQRAKYEPMREAFVAGELRATYIAAQAYLGRFWDIENTAPPADRVREWLGPDLGELALKGFEATLCRTDLPPAAAVAESYADDRRWSYVVPILAGVLERARLGRDFDDLDPDVVIAARMALLREGVDADAGADALEDALAGWFADRPQAAERFTRLMIEPQLRRGKPHVAGLYQLVRKEKPPTLKTLIPEWLEAFPNMDCAAEYELVGHLLQEGASDQVAQAHAHRKAIGFKDEDHALTWLAIGFVVDFDGHRDALSAAASEATLLGHIRKWRSHARKEEAPSRPLTLSAATWVFETFRTRFPATYRFSGTARDEDNSVAVDSTDFMMAVVREIAADLSDAAMETMDRLRQAPEDGYSDTIRSARTQQIVARRERDFTPPGLEQLLAVATGASPLTVMDLKALALDALAEVQRQIRGDDLDSVSLFYDDAGPRDENGCRDRLGVLLRGVLPYGIDIIPERAAPGHTRADLVFTLGPLHLPVEAKGQWHPELWSAVRQQLDRRYTRDWRANDAGVYLVFWFGLHVPKTRKLRGPPRGSKPPQTPLALREALEADIPEHRRGSLSVVVLDLMRPTTA
jgi:hypothetical protein